MCAKHPDNKGMQAISQTLKPGMKAREPRRKILIHARMRVDGAWADVCLRDISSRGLLAMTASAPPRGTYVEIFRASIVIVGRVVWSNDRRFGVHTQERLNILAVIGEASKTGSSSNPGAATVVERRSDPSRLTGAAVAERLERSRQISSAAQFSMLAAASLVAAVTVGTMVHDSLKQSLSAVSSHLVK